MMMTWSCTHYGLSCREERYWLSRAHPRRSAASSTSSCRGRGRVGRAVQFVHSALKTHNALGGRQASTGYGPATGASASAQPSEGRTKAWWHHRDRAYDLPVMRWSCRNVKPLGVVRALGVIICLTESSSIHHGLRPPWPADLEVSIFKKERFIFHSWY